MFTVSAWTLAQAAVRLKRYGNVTRAQRKPFITLLTIQSDKPFPSLAPKNSQAPNGLERSYNTMD